jgi:DNA-binding response OmpR family regulator
MKSKLKVLIVEDDKAVKIVYNIGLYESVFAKRFSENGTEALQIFDEWQPDIVILDIMLPGMSGFEVLKAIRQERQDNSTTIMMASSHSGRSEVTECLRFGIQGYVIKPFTHRDIGSKVLDYYQKVNPERAKAALVEFESARRRDLRG